MALDFNKPSWNLLILAGSPIVVVLGPSDAETQDKDKRNIY